MSHEEIATEARAGYVSLMRTWADEHKGGILVGYSIIGAIYSMWVLVNMDSPIMLGLQMFTLGAVLTMAMQYKKESK